MKTTVELPDTLLKEAKRAARRRGMTLRALLEQALRRTLAESQSRQPFALRDASVSGRGLSPDFAGSSWDTIRDVAYKDHGG